ncbi:OmpA family protein [Mameliella sediminis]|uniref:OmpA family protein n=1 Tax=Mameliella sediminis TaxID=2836866 RepID=UPI001C46C620|nr:OmpA family protein [Mameliella sediminis]MBV7394445.1 OmpA family protein [Mameliella sediminis]MBY6113162.1 OmpA family protein [Antarctobacter heliothermus]MBY6143490.1 OmpA family protein [Mameliella alba]MCA0952786.1 OmpA family protein [Mameliella alba]
MTNTTRRRAEALALGSALGLAVLAGSVGAVELTLPRDAQQSFGTVQSPGAYALPTGPWQNGYLPVERVEGRVEVAAWHIPDNGDTPFQLAQPLRDALVAAGFEILLDCRARACGGFDFRFGTLVLPAPEMFVDLSDYHFISALSEKDGAVSILTSRDARAGYIQIIQAGGKVGEVRSAPAPKPSQPATAPPPAPSKDIVDTLETKGHLILGDLVFRSGSTSLGEGRFASLDAIAAYLGANPSRQILFVGHTDATGSLEANRRVSLRRAEAAMAYLRDRHGIPAAQIGAEGVGYLAPVASNLTPEGREANRRVEAVLISTE